MRFFKLEAPYYPTVRHADRRNPVQQAVHSRIPGVDCPVCGRWSSSDRLRLVQPRAEFGEVRFLSLAEWRAQRPEWAHRLGVSEEALTPGAELGPPHAIRISEVVEDVVHGVPGDIWVGSRGAEAFRHAQLRGCELIPVEFDTPERESLCALVPLGSAWRVGTRERDTVQCDECGRRGFPRPEYFEIDVTRWDGSDLFIVDRNPNILFASQRMRDIAVELGLSNLEFREVGPTR